MPDFGVETITLDLPALVGGFGRRLDAAGIPVTAERSARFAQALQIVGRADTLSRRRLYWTARGVLVSDRAQVPAFDAVFAAVFGAGAPRPVASDPFENTEVDTAPSGADPVASAERASDDALPAGSAAAPAPTHAPRRQDETLDERPVPALASGEELLRAKRFDALEPGELAQLYRLMGELSLATPKRRTRRREPSRHGARVDLRRTLRRSLRTGGDPVRLALRRRRVVQRRLVLLCDISGSMEPYARAYLQFLTCAAGTGRNEAFVFATRLTRLTRALHWAGGTRSAERAIQRAAATAPDWSSGTRIGDALKAFNDRHGRRGMARGAVVVILSDGWERGDPALVAQEMERLSRLAHRIVWVNPRVAAAGFSPRAGGMAAALPHCDALVSGHSLDALHQVVAAIGAEEWPRPEVAAVVDDEETWASATTAPGSSVAMPSGYGPSRGRTTPGWSI